MKLKDTQYLSSGERVELHNHTDTAENCFLNSSSKFKDYFYKGARTTARTEKSIRLVSQSVFKTEDVAVADDKTTGTLIFSQKIGNRYRKE